MIEHNSPWGTSEATAVLFAESGKTGESGASQRDLFEPNDESSSEESGVDETTTTPKRTRQTQGGSVSKRNKKDEGHATKAVRSSPRKNTPSSPAKKNEVGPKKPPKRKGSKI